jgi:hypothetical protein
MKGTHCKSARAPTSIHGHSKIIICAAAGRRTECGALTPGLWPHLSRASQAFADHACQAACQLASNVSWSGAARARCSPGSRSKRRLRLVREAR